jgi:hypothetical protein
MRQICISSPELTENDDRDRLYLQTKGWLNRAGGWVAA